MKIYKEDYLHNFEFWSGACSRVDVMTEEQLDQIEAIFEELYPDGMKDVQINDIFWHDCDWVAEVLGFKNFEALERFNEEGQKYLVRICPLNKAYEYIAEEFESKEDAEDWIDENLDTYPDFLEYKGTDTDIEICNNLDDDDYYTYITLNENEDDE